MAVDAYVHHYLPGRLRLRIPAAKGEEDELRELSSAIARAPGVSQVEYNPITGSILIQYSPTHYRNLQSLEASLSASAVPIAVNNSHPAQRQPHHRRHRRGRSVAAKKVDSFFRQLDSEIRDATDNEVDLKFILPFGVTVLGILALRHSSTTPLWLTLLIFAFHSFLGLHTPTPEQLGITEDFVEPES
jgi:Heavy metal associated domain 2